MSTVSEADMNAFVAALAEATIRDELITPDVIYIDLMMMRDIHLGSLVYLIAQAPDDKQNTMWAHIIDRYQAYTQRTSMDIARVFPKLGITLKDVHDLWADHPELHDALVQISPETAYVRTIQAHLAINANHSRVEGKRNHVRGILNVYPMKLSPHLTEYIGKFYADLLSMDLDVVYIPYDQLSAEYLRGIDELNIFSLHELMHREDVRADMLDFKWHHKFVLNPALIHHDALTQLSQDEHQTLSDTAVIMRTMCRYKHVPTAYITGVLTNGASTKATFNPGAAEK